MAAAQPDLTAAFSEAARLQAAGRFADSVPVLEAILAGAPQSAEAWANLGGAFVRLERLDEAEAAYRKAAALRPDADWALRGLGSLLHYTGRWREALALYEQALALAPDDPRLQLNLGYIRLGLGDFTGGWPLFERRAHFRDQHARPPAFGREWRGEPLAGRRLLVWPEQGFGDQIQFARFAPALQRMGAAVTLACAPELVALFQSLGVPVVDQTTAEAAHDADFWSLVMSLPGRLGVTLEGLAGDAYLAAPEDRRRKWAGHAPPGSIGVVWRGRQDQLHRSLPSPELLAPLRRLGRPLVDLTEPLGDFADTAAVMEQLDAIVSIDTAAAHLAGALGKPCRLMLPAYRQDWRWMQGRGDCPWYRSVRLYRQARIGDWEDVVVRVAADLEAL